MANTEQQVYSFGSCVVNVANRELLVRGKEMKVQKRVFDLLVYLIENRDRAVSKDEILENVWAGRITTDAALARVVMKARKVVGDDAEKQEVIKTLHGHGYRFVASFEPIVTPREISSRKDSIQAGRRMHPGVWLTLTVVSVFLAWFAWQGKMPEEASPASGVPGSAISVEPWRQADALFQKDLLWRGGGGAISVELGAGRIVWFFGESIVAKSPGFDRNNSTSIRNSVAVQKGYDPTVATIEFFWRTDQEKPTSYFPSIGSLWYWPLDAVLLDQSILVFLVESKRSNEGLGFTHTRVVARLIQNIDQPPPDWKIKEVLLPENSAEVLLGYSGVLIRDKHVYAFSKQEPTADTYLARWDLETWDIDGVIFPQWWCGESCGWIEHTQDLAQAKPILSDTHTSVSIRFNQETGKFLLFETYGFGSAVVTARSSDALTGPWSSRQIIYHPEERSRPGIMIYGGRIQQGLLGADAVMTYDVNSEIVSELLTDTSIYFPRFLKIDIDGVDATD